MDSLPAESFGKKPANNIFSRTANTPGLKFKHNEISFYIPFQKPRGFWFQNVLMAQNENQSYEFFFFLKKCFFLKDFFFWCGSFSNVFIEFVTILLLFHAFWFFGCVACGLLAPLPQIESAPLALEGEVLTIGSPRKFLKCIFIGFSFLDFRSLWNWLSSVSPQGELDTFYLVSIRHWFLSALSTPTFSYPPKANNCYCCC